MKALLTGGLGFIGYNFYERFKSAMDFLVIDKGGYASNPVAQTTISNLEVLNIESPRVMSIIESFRPDFVFHFAAESHVDRSIVDPMPFLESNVRGTLNLLHCTRAMQDKPNPKNIRFVQVSTDEVYGSLGESGVFTEETPLAPNSPYSASKASADCFARAYHETFGLHVVTTRCSNNYGPWQFPEKLIPLMIRKAVRDEHLPVYGTGNNIRDWIHVDDHCRGIMAAALLGRSGEVYNFGGGSQMTNLDVVRTILRHLGKPESLIRFVKDRSGHDFRYAIDHTKATRELGWVPRKEFSQGLMETVQWNLDHVPWIETVAQKQRDFERVYYAERGHDSSLTSGRKGEATL